MNAKEGQHIIPISKTTHARNTVSGTSFGPAQIIARQIKQLKNNIINIVSKN
jgi:hypothetical protein